MNQRDGFSFVYRKVIQKVFEYGSCGRDQKRKTRAEKLIEAQQNDMKNRGQGGSRAQNCKEDFDLPIGIDKFNR